MGLADGPAVATVASLPWSTSVTSILIALSLLAVIPTIDLCALGPIILTPAGGLPILLWLLALVGMLWAIGIPLVERWHGLTSTQGWGYAFGVGIAAGAMLKIKSQQDRQPNG